MRAVSANTGDVARRGPSRAGVVLLAVAVAAWLAGIGGGLTVLASYANRAPDAAVAPGAWPAGSHLTREDGKAAVVVFIHPKCPCSSATLGELNRVLARAPGASTVTVAFYAPSAETAAWGQTSLREQAEAIPGVRVTDDTDGREAMLFGALNSGHVVVYSASGQLRFHGGVTASRGHEGDNLGADCVVEAIRGVTPSAPTTPTFGCELTSPDDVSGCPECDDGGPS